MQPRESKPPQDANAHAEGVQQGMGYHQQGDGPGMVWDRTAAEGFQPGGADDEVSAQTQPATSPYVSREGEQTQAPAEKP